MKKIVLLLFHFLNFLSIFAQAPDWKWAKNINAYNTAIALDNFGNTFLAGTFIAPSLLLDTILLSNPNAATVASFFVAKYNEKGKVIWAKNLSGYTESGASVTDLRGAVYIAGNFSGTLNFGSDSLVNSSITGNDIFVAKYDSSGNFLWAQAVKGLYTKFVQSVAIDLSGNLVLAGEFTGNTIMLDTVILQNNVGQTSFIARYSTNGNLIWAKSATSTNVCHIYGVSTDSLGNIYSTGTFDGPSVSFGTKTLTSPGIGSFYLYVTKFDSLGNALWAKKGAGYVLNSKVATDAQGNSYLCGTFLNTSLTFGSFTLTNANLNYSEMFVVKYAANGTCVWAKREGNIYDDYASDIALDKSGKPRVTGYYKSGAINFDLYTLSNSNPSLVNDGFVVAYDTAGVVKWAKSLGGGGQDEVQHLAINNNANVFISGFSSSSLLKLGTDTLLFINGQIFFAKLDSVPTSACQASFFVQPDTLPHHYIVYNQSTGSSPLTYLWHWGDGTVSAGAAPVHNYSTSGTYTICLTVTDSTGCMAVFCDQPNYYYKNSANAFIVTLTVINGSPTSVEESGRSDNYSLLFPNPSNRFVRLKSNSKIDLIEVYNVWGEICYVSKPNSNLSQFNIENEGMYFVRITSNGNSSIQKIVIQH